MGGGFAACRATTRSTSRRAEARLPVTRRAGATGPAADRGEPHRARSAPLTRGSWVHGCTIGPRAGYRLRVRSRKCRRVREPAHEVVRRDERIKGYTWHGGRLKLDPLPKIKTLFFTIFLLYSVWVRLLTVLSLVTLRAPLTVAVNSSPDGPARPGLGGQVLRVGGQVIGRRWEEP